MRIYLPATSTDLASLRDEGLLSGPRPGCAVTPELQSWYANSDLEEVEYAALLEAARLSLRMIDVDPGAARRRVVIAAEVSDSAVEADPGSGRGAVRLAGDLILADVISLHVDGTEAETAIIAATAVVIEADLGSEEAQFTVDEAEAHELGWYAIQELGPLLEFR